MGGQEDRKQEVIQDARAKAASPLRIVILGLSITSSWGNGHATTYRALVRALNERGHDVLFLERDVPWYASNRDLAQLPFARLGLYRDLKQLSQVYTEEVRGADLVLVGSYVPEGVEVGDWVIQVAHGAVAFYDIDTPVTLAKLQRGDYEYLAPRQIAAYDLYLSFAGGPVLNVLERKYGSPAARPFYCSVDPAMYYPENQGLRWDLGYMGTYSPDRQPALEELLLRAAYDEPSSRFVVAGPNFPAEIAWPGNVERIEHLPPTEHCAFYNRQRYTLNVTRADMIKMGYSPSVRLFEAAACGTPIISDQWPGLETIFVLGEELLVAGSAQDVSAYLHEIDEEQRQRIGHRARERVMREHTALHRAVELEQHYSRLEQSRKGVYHQ
jgi:spore maturation protein CgeB